MQFFDIRLRRIACVSVSAAIWEIELAKKETEELFLTGNENNIIADKWGDKIKDVKKRISPNLLPQFLYYELVRAVCYMGLRILKWFEHLDYDKLLGQISTSVLFEQYCKKISWTHYGTIDEAKIFQFYWLSNPNADLFKMYNIACIYCLEEEIESLWEKVSKKYTDKRYQQEHWNWNIGIFKNYRLDIVSYWNYLRNQSADLLSHLLRRGPALYDANRTIEENMLKLCAFQGYAKGFKYFWNKLDNEKKINNILPCLKWIREEMVVLVSGMDDNYCEILMLMVSFPKFTETMASSPDLDFYNFFNILAVFFPWQEKFFSALDFLPPRCIEKRHTDIFDFLVMRLEIERKYNLPLESSELHKMLNKLWRIMSVKCKLNVADSLILHSFKITDFSTIKLILNDEDLIEQSQLLLQECDLIILNLLRDENELERFFFELLMPVKCEESEKMELKILYKYLIQSDFKTADMFLSSLINNNSRAKRNLKINLEIRYICLYCFENDQLDLAEKFLIWIFELTEKVNEFKESLKNSTICEISHF